jgi:hypothetical protein
LNENGGAPLEPAVCGRCAAPFDPDDNFCRHCGQALQSQYLPVVRSSSNLPALSPPALPAVVVKGATVVVAGAIAELVLRRVARRVFSRKPKAERPPQRNSRRGAVAGNGHLPEGTAVESETFFLRRVRIRR